MEEEKAIQWVKRDNFFLSVCQYKRINSYQHGAKLYGERFSSVLKPYSFGYAELNFRSHRPQNFKLSISPQYKESVYTYLKSCIRDLYN